MLNDVLIINVNKCFTLKNNIKNLEEAEKYVLKKFNKIDNIEIERYLIKFMIGDHCLKYYTFDDKKLNNSSVPYGIFHHLMNGKNNLKSYQIENIINNIVLC